MMIPLFLAFPIAFALDAALGHLLLVKAANGYVDRVRAKALQAPNQWE